MIFFEQPTQYFIKKYNEIINYLIKGNFISFNNDIIYPTNISEISDLLRTYYPSESLILKTLPNFFDIKVFDFHQVEQQKIKINEICVIYNDTFYFRDIFSQKSFAFYQKYKQYSVINNIGIISEDNYNKLLNNKLKTEEEINFVLDHLIQEALFSHVEEISISTEGNILFKSNANSYYINKNINLKEDFQFNDKFISFNKELYSIFMKRYKIEDKNNFTFKIVKKDQYSFNNIKMRHYDKIKSFVHENKGIVLLSSKNNNNIYYDILQKLSTENKKIISFDTEKNFLIPNITNYSKDYNHNLNLLMFDIIFINDVNKYNDVFLKSIELGKLVIVFMTGKDSLSSILNLMNNTNINKYSFSENFLCSFHYTELPKLCDCCKVEKNIKEIEIFNENKYSIYNYGIGNHKVFVNNPEGCEKCVKGYSDKTYISEILINDNDISDYIENIFNVRQLRNFIKSKRWESEEDNALYLLKKGDISIIDIKKYS